MVEIKIDRHNDKLADIKTLDVVSDDYISRLKELGDELRILNQRVKAFEGNEPNLFLYDPDTGRSRYLGKNPEARRIQGRLDEIGKEAARHIMSYLTREAAVDLSLLVPFPSEFLGIAVDSLPHEHKVAWREKLGISRNGHAYEKGELSS